MVVVHSARAECLSAHAGLVARPRETGSVIGNSLALFLIGRKANEAEI